MIKKKNYLLLPILAILSIIIIAIIPNYCMADPISNPDDYKPGGVTDSDVTAITDKTENILGAIVTVGVVISAIMLTILGIKYMLGSVEEKAEYKKTMIPYLIGTVLLFSASTIVGIIAKLVENTNLVQ